jgi:type IV pilus assembly protein PilE
MRRKIWGFTVIELVAVVAIIGILAAIAYPIFAEQGRKARRADAMTSLNRIALAEEKLRANCTRYATGLAGAGSCTARTVASITTSTYGHYRLAIASATTTAYAITAQPISAAQVADAVTGSCPMPKCCGTFSVNQDGPNLTGSYANAACWKQ